MKRFIIIVSFVLMVFGVVALLIHGSNKNENSNEPKTKDSLDEIKRNIPLEIINKNTEMAEAISDDDEYSRKMKELFDKTVKNLNKDSSKKLQLLKQYQIRANGLAKFDEKAKEIENDIDQLKIQFKELDREFDEAYFRFDVESAKKTVDKSRNIEQQILQRIAELEKLIHAKNAEASAIRYGVAKIHIEGVLVKYNNLLRDYEIEKLLELYNSNESNIDEIKTSLLDARSTDMRRFKFIKLKRLYVHEDQAIVTFQAKVKTRRGLWVDVTRSKYFVLVGSAWKFDFEKEKIWLTARYVVKKLTRMIDLTMFDESGFAELSSEKFIGISEFIESWDIAPELFADIGGFELDNFVIKLKPGSETEFYLACKAGKRNPGLRYGIVCYDSEDKIWFDNYLYGSKTYQIVDSEDD